MKILLIMPKFFNYPETIQMGLRNLGHDVKWVDDRPSNDPFTKALVRVNKEVLSRPIDRYFESVRHDAEEAQYDPCPRRVGTIPIFRQGAPLKAKVRDP